MNQLTGLSSREAALRLKQNGPNTLARRKEPSLVIRFLQKLSNPLIVLLLVAAIISAFLGQTSDFFIIVAITVVSIALDVYQEASAVGAAEKLRKRVSITATVIRDGVTVELPLRDIVVGDIVQVIVGDIIPADCRIISSKDLILDESTLTGESFPREIHPDDKTSRMFMGTNVITGEGTGEVTATGAHTQLGNISEHLVAPRPKTEFEQGINAFGLLLMRTAIVVCVFVFAAHLIFAHNIWSSLLFVLAIAIGFAPELLPMVVTINLSRGALRMSKHGVIVKSLPSIENFGSMDILATDKTGTLTENRIILERYEDTNGAKSTKVLQYGYLGSIFQSGFRGPMEDAILAHTEAASHGFTRTGVIPFDFYRKRVSVMVSRGTVRLLITKGAPEDIIKLSNSYEATGHVITMTPAKRKKMLTQVDSYGREGLRVLGVAYKANGTHEKDLTFLGFMAFLDPAKKTVSESLLRLTRHHIGIKILTGDSDVVTEKICRDIGLTVTGIIRGEELTTLSDEELGVRVEATTIFARVNPDMKLRIITALRKNGHVVGYMGDGINDAPSIRAADVGISVENASDVAKLSADIILLRKDLHVLMEGVHEGRVTFTNVLKYLKMNISSDFGNMVSIAVASVFLPFLPMLPVQVLLNDMLYDVSQLTLASDTVEERYLRLPRKWDVTNIRKFMLIFGPASSVFDLVTFGILLWIFHARPEFFQTGWFLESVVTQTLIIFSIRTQAVPFYKSHPSKLFAFSLFAVVALAIALPYLPIAAGFSFVRMPPVYFVILIGLLAAYLMLVERLKQWFYSTSDV
jgi:Mg2+-importing ATPase